MRLLADDANRVGRMSKVSDSYSWEEMCELSDEDMDNLLRFYPANEVPSIDLLQSLRGNARLDNIDLFDGSFGFSVGA